MILNKYEFVFYKKPVKYSFEKDSFEESIEEVLKENENHLVLDNPYFTRLDKKKDRTYNFNPVINYPSISVYVNDTIFGNRVSYTLYSRSKKRPETIKKEIRDAIKNKVGWLDFKVDLSLIK